MRVAVFGYGSMGHRHASNAQALGHEVAVYDPWLIAGERYTSHIVALPSEDAIFDWRPRAVIIASPVEHHVRQFWRCVEHQTHVLVEKPLARSAAEFLQGHAEAREHHIPGYADVRMVGYNLRFHAGLAYVRDMLPRCGRPLAARVQIHCDRATWPGASYGSTLLECSHEIDLARWLLGSAVMMTARRCRDGHAWEIGLQHDQGCVTTVEIADDVPGYKRAGEIVGSDGTLHWRWHAPTLAFHAWGDGHGWSSDLRLAVSAEDTYRAELRAFFSAAEYRPEIATYADGLAVLDLVDAAERIARQ